MESESYGAVKGRLLLSWETDEQVAGGEGGRLHCQKQGAETRSCLSGEGRRLLRLRGTHAEFAALTASTALGATAYRTHWEG